MAESYASSGVKVMLVDVQDKDPGWKSLEAHVAKSVILVRDATGDVSCGYAPPKALPAFSNRAEVMLAATVVVDKLGKIAAFELISTNPGGEFRTSHRSARTSTVTSRARAHLTCSM